MQPSPTASLIMWVYHVFDDMFRRDGLSTVRNLRNQTPPFRLVEPRAWRHLILLFVAGAGIFSVSQVYLQYHPLPEPLWIGVLSLEVFVVALSSLAPAATTATVATVRSLLGLYRQYGYIASVPDTETSLIDLRLNLPFYNSLLATISIAAALMVSRPFLSSVVAWSGMLLSLTLFYRSVYLLYLPLLVFWKLNFFFAALNWIEQRHQSLEVPCRLCAARQAYCQALASMLESHLAARRVRSAAGPL